METINRSMTGKKERPIKVLQFGEGNFLRAFVDYMIDIANEKGVFDGDVVLVKPIESDGGAGDVWGRDHSDGSLRRQGTF